MSQTTTEVKGTKKTSTKRCFHVNGLKINKLDLVLVICCKTVTRSKSFSIILSSKVTHRCIYMLDELKNMIKSKVKVTSGDR